MTHDATRLGPNWFEPADASDPDIVREIARVMDEKPVEPGWEVQSIETEWFCRAHAIADDAGEPIEVRITKTPAITRVDHRQPSVVSDTIEEVQT